MKLYKLSLALVLGLGMLASCGDKLELVNPNQQTTGTFGFNADDSEDTKPVKSSKPHHPGIHQSYIPHEHKNPPYEYGYKPL